MKYAYEAAAMPKAGQHFAIVEFSSIFIPGDERSRTNPGHGYPDRTEPTVRYITFDTEEEWKAAIEKRTLRNETNFVPIIAQVPTIVTTVNVAVRL